MKKISLLALLISHAACAETSTTTVVDIAYTEKAPVIDGAMTEPVWGKAVWQPMDQLILGAAPTADDFSGRYKLLWNEQALYLLAEIQDDHLVDSRPDPLEAYWDDDALEVFIDADAERGPHTNDYRAFAYHIALDNQSVDIGPDGPALFPDHVTSRWQRNAQSPHTIVWEVAIRIATQADNGQTLTGFRNLKARELIGFMLAYCDADDAAGRQHFVGDIDIPPRDGDKNLGYRDSSVFGAIRLVRDE